MGLDYSDRLPETTPIITVAVRRVHDTNRTGAWFFMPVVWVIFACFDGDRSENRFGRSPKYQGLTR